MPPDAPKNPIDAGRIKRGARSPGIRDVAAIAHVSYKTVSRVINDSPHVSPEVRSRVENAIRQLDYRPNMAARALATHRSRTIGVLTVDLSQSAPSTDVLALERVARTRGYGIALASAADVSEVVVRKAVDQLVSRGVDGMVLEALSPIRIQPGALATVPVVSRFGTIPDVPLQTTLGTDEAGAGRVAAQYLLGLGHLSTAHISGPLDSYAARQRLDGWAAAHRVRGLTEPPSYEGDWTASSGYQLGRRILTQHPGVTAIFVANDHMAMGVLRAATEAGKVVPRDLSIVGMDNAPEGEYQVVPLSTVSADWALVATRTLAKLVDLIEGQPASAEKLIPTHLEIRASSGPPTAAT